MSRAEIVLLRLKCIYPSIGTNKILLFSRETEELRTLLKLVTSASLDGDLSPSLAMPVSAASGKVKWSTENPVLPSVQGTQQWPIQRAHTSRGIQQITEAKALEQFRWESISLLYIHVHVYM